MFCAAFQNGVILQ